MFSDNFSMCFHHASVIEKKKVEDKLARHLSALLDINMPAPTPTTLLKTDIHDD